MVRHGELQHTVSALLLGQLQTGAVPFLEHAGIGVHVCGDNQLCTHRHSIQVGNLAAVLQGDLCIGDLERKGLGLRIGFRSGGSRDNKLCYDRHIVCGHLKVDSLAGSVRALGQIFSMHPTIEGETIRLRCLNRDIIALKVAPLLHTVHGHAVLLGVLRGQGNIVRGHSEAEHCAAGIRTIGQLTLYFPTGKGVAILLGGNDGLDQLVLLVLFYPTVLTVLILHGQGILLGGDHVIIQVQVNVICGHLKGDGLAGKICTCGHTIRLPSGSVALLLVCGNADLFALNVLRNFSVHIQDVLLCGDGGLFIQRLQDDVLCGHLKGDGLVGSNRTSGHTTRIPLGEGVAVLLGCGDADLFVLSVLLNFGSFAVHSHGKGRLARTSYNKGTHLFGKGIVIVCILIHHDIHIIASGGGGNSRVVVFGALGGKHLGHARRGGIVIILALVGHLVLRSIVAKVRSHGRVADDSLTHNNGAGLVLFAFLCSDDHLIAAIRSTLRGVGINGQCLACIFAGNVLALKRELANVFLTNAFFIAGQRVGAVLVLSGSEVPCFKALKGQLFGGFAGLVHHNILTVIAAAKDQSLAVIRKGSARISADRLAVDVRDRLAEGKYHPGFANAVNSGYICHRIAVDIGHNTVHVTQLALLLTGGKVCAVNAVKAHRIGNSGLAVITRQAAKDHGVLDDRRIRCMVGQLDIVEHTGGDLSVFSQFDRCVEHAAGDGAGLVEGDFLVEVSAFNNGVIELDRSIGIHTGNGHVLQRDAIALQRRLRGVDLTRGQVYRAAVRAGDKDQRLGNLRTVLALILVGPGGVLPTQTLIEGGLHAPAGYLLGLHLGQVGQTLFGNAQGLDRTDIGGLVHQNILAVIVAGNMQHLALGRGVGVVVCNCIIVDAQHSGVQRDICSACAHQIDGIDGKGQASAIYCRNIAVAHHQLADLLPGCQCTLKVVRQRAKHGIRNGKLAVVEKGMEHAVQNNCIGNGALAVAGQGVKDTAGDLDLAGIACRANANTSIGIDAAGDLAAGKHQSALFAKRCVRNGGIGQLNRAVDGGRAQLFEIDLSAALICHHQNAPRIREFWIVDIGPVAAQVGLALMFALVQAFHAGHIGHVGHTLIGKVQFLAHGLDRDQLHGGIARDRTKAGRELSAVFADGDNGNDVALAWEVIVGNACEQGHNAAVVTGSSYRPALAGGVAFHHQLQVSLGAGIDDIDIPGFLPAVQGAVLRQDQLVCLLLRVGLQAGDIAEKATLDLAAVLHQLIIGAALNGAGVQLYIGVAAAKNIDAGETAGGDPKHAFNCTIQQIHGGAAYIVKEHIAADRAIQNVLCRCISNAANGQHPASVAPAGTGCCLGQTGIAKLDLDHLILRFRVRTNILIVALRAISDAVGLFRCRGRKPRPCICKCGYREDREHHTEGQYHAQNAFFHDILSFVG